MHNQHKWEEVRDENHQVVTEYSSMIQWRCIHCGTSIYARWKPTPKFLKSRGIGRTCQEQLCLNVMKA
jgi:hypothetical protein